MAYYDDKTNKTLFSAAIDLHNGWMEVDCGCSNGLTWGGLMPKTCNRCNGNGIIYWHKKSKMFAEYPGGKLRGRGNLSNLEKTGSEQSKKRENVMPWWV